MHYQMPLQIKDKDKVLVNLSTKKDFTMKLVIKKLKAVNMHEESEGGN